MAAIFGQLAGSVMGGLMANQGFEQARGDINDLAQSNPQGFLGPGGFGIQENGNVIQGAGQDQLSQMLQAKSAEQLGGGLFNDPRFQQAFGGNDIAGAFNAAQGGPQAQGQFAGGLQGLFGGAQNQFNQLGGQFGQGLQDASGGAQAGLFQGGMQNIQNAGNISGLVQQNLDASNALAAPGEQKAINSFANNEFLRTGGGTSGATQRAGELQNNLMAANDRRVLGAQQLGMQQQQQLGQLGLGQVGAGQGLLGQNINQFQGLGQLQQGFGGLANQTNMSGFQQALQANQQNTSAGNQRLQNSLGLFGIGNQTQNQAFNQGLAGQGALTARDQLAASTFLGQQNADANRISATGLHAQALGQAGVEQGGILGGLVSSFF